MLHEQKYRYIRNHAQKGHRLKKIRQFFYVFLRSDKQDTFHENLR